MNKLLNKFAGRKHQKHASILGVAFEGGAMTAIELHRREERCETGVMLRQTLSQDILSGNPELLGAEIRKILEDAGVREKKCVVSLPLSWVYVIYQDIPEALTESDVDNYIALQIEKKLPFSPEDVVVSSIHFEAAAAGRRAVIAAVPVQHVRSLEKIMRASRLHVAGMALGVAALSGGEEDVFSVSFFAHQDGMDMVIGRGGKVYFIRSFPGAVSLEKEEPFVDAEMIIREMRITLGRLPEDIRAGMKSYRILGEASLVEIFKKELVPLLSRMGLEFEDKKLLACGIEVSQMASPQTCAAAMNTLFGRPNHFEFLPPAAGRLEKLMGRISSRRLFWQAAAGAALAALAIIIFGVQALILGRYERKWSAMEPDVRRVSALQEKIRKYRPWHDDVIRSLSVLREITKAFPEEGSIWVKSVEIRGMASLQMSGEAKSEKAWLAMLAKLRENKTIGDLKVSQVKKGDGVLQFTISFSI